MVRGSLAAHFLTHHGVAKEGLGKEVDRYDRGNNPRTYRMAFPKKARPSHFPGEEYSG